MLTHTQVVVWGKIETYLCFIFYQQDAYHNFLSFREREGVSFMWVNMLILQILYERFILPYGKVRVLE